MTDAVPLLTACLLVLSILLLSLNLRSAWRWWLKAGAVALTFGAVVAFFIALEWLMGWPSAAAPPPRFTLHGALVREPAPRRQPPEPGAIYLWLSPEVAAGESAGPPRAHVMPYSRALHEQVEEARQQMQGGGRVDGRTDRPGGDDYGSLQIELYEAPPAVLPRKDGDGS